MWLKDRLVYGMCLTPIFDALCLIKLDLTQKYTDQSARAVEYIDYISADGEDSPSNECPRIWH